MMELKSKYINQRYKQNKMFRQKMADVTDCSCRLIPNQSNQYMLFKTPNSNVKPTIKEPKQKFSLKTQTNSSTKQQNKVTSAQKVCLKPVKISEDQKISISANLDAKKHKFEKNFVCSPENSQVRKIDENNVHATVAPPNQNYFGKMQNGIKTAENNRFKQQKFTLLNSHNQMPPHPHHSKDPHYKVSELPKKSLNFQEYYKYVSNPYSMTEKNKENMHMGNNPQVSRYKMDLKMKKEMRRMRNETLPLQEIDTLPQIQVFHDSLEKCERFDQKQSRGTYNGSFTTKNSLNSQADSMRTSKNQQASLLNSKISQINQNPSLQFQRGFEQENEIRFNQSSVLTQRDYNINSHRISRKDLKSHLVTQVSVNDITDYFQPSSPGQIHQKAYCSVQNSKVRHFPFNEIQQNFNEAPKIAKSQPQNFDQIFTKKQQNLHTNFIIEKASTLSDIMNKSAQCESVLGEGEESCNENEESVVIMRYQDLLDENKDNHIGGFEGDMTTSNFFLRPEHLLLDEQLYEKPGDKYMLDSTKNTTNVKVYGRQQDFTYVGDSNISTNPNLKKTVKPQKEYAAHNFTLLS